MTRDYSSCLDFESLKKAARNAVKRSADYDEMKKIRKQACMLVEDGILTREQYFDIDFYLNGVTKYAFCTDLESLKEEFEVIKGRKYIDYLDFCKERREILHYADGLYRESKAITSDEYFVFLDYVNSIKYEDVRLYDEYDAAYGDNDYDDDEAEDGSFDDSGYSSRMVNDSDMAPGDDYLMDIGVVDVDDYD